MMTIDLGIASHDCPWLGLFDDHLKRTEVDLSVPNQYLRNSEISGNEFTELLALR